MTNENLAHIITRLEKLEKAVFGSDTKEKRVSAKTSDVKTDIDFSINERAFVKRYTTDKSGPKKFTLLLAYLAKGEIDKNIELSEIKKHWGKMTSKALLGKFNMFYPNDAKTRGWIDSKEYGNYNLTNEWKTIV
jgi:uncharacterized protein YkuJ